jgi:hypothetical protein
MDHHHTLHCYRARSRQGTYTADCKRLYSWHGHSKRLEPGNQGRLHWKVSAKSLLSEMVPRVQQLMRQTMARIFEGDSRSEVRSSACLSRSDPQRQGEQRWLER